MSAFTDLTRNVIANWRRNVMRSFLTTLGIIIAVMTVVTILSLVGGLDAFIREQIGALGANSFVINRFGMVQSQEQWMEAAKRPNISFEQYDALIKRLEGEYLYASPLVASWQNIAAEGEELQYISTRGTGSDMVNINERPLVYGRYFTPGEQQRRRDVAVLGYGVSKELFGDGVDPVGRRLTVGGRPFTIIGVYIEQGRLMGQSTDEFIEIPYTTFLKYLGIRRSVSISIRARSQKQLAELMDRAEVEFRRIRRLDPDEADDFGVISEKLLTSVFEQMTGLIFAVMIVVGGVSLVVGGIGIMNVMLVAVSERTREIGIRRALGATRRDILNQFLLEAVMVTFIGGLVGVGLGALMGSLVGSLVDLPVEVSLGSIILAMGFCGLVGIAFGIFPALKAAQLDPITALQKS